MCQQEENDKKELEENLQMSRLEALKLEIEEKRIELNELFETGNYQKYSEKSKQIDKLIEEYIDLDK